MGLGEWLLENREAIGPSWRELLWIMRPTDPQHVSINRAAAYLRKDKRTVARNFRRLERQGILERTAVPGRAHSLQSAFLSRAPPSHAVTGYATLAPCWTQWLGLISWQNRPVINQRLRSRGGSLDA